MALKKLKKPKRLKRGASPAQVAAKAEQIRKYEQRLKDIAKAKKDVENLNNKLARL